MFMNPMDVYGTELDPQRTGQVVRALKDEVEAFVEGNNPKLDFRRLRVVFSDELLRKTYRIKKGEGLRRHGREMTSEEGWGDALRDRFPVMGDLWEEEGAWCFTSPVLGRFFPKEMKIVLYRRAIFAYAQAGGYDEMSILNAVLAHEFFHAYHFLDCKDHGRDWNRPRALAVLVKESLAAAFEYAILEKMGERRACQDLAAFWDLLDVNAYPYSGALGMLKEKTILINKHHVIGHVYTDSLAKWKLAAEDVVGLYRVEGMG